MRMRIPFPAALVISVALWTAGPARAQSGPDTTYLPLSGENFWGYVNPRDGSGPIWRGVRDSVRLGDTLYYVVDLPFLVSDTLRVAQDGRVHARYGRRDALLFDVHAEDGSTYVLPDPHPGFEPSHEYEVSVRHRGLVQVEAGSFEDCISFSFDIPTAVDDEWGATLAPGVGIVSAGGGGGDYGELWLARVGDHYFPPLDASIPDTLDWHGYVPLEVGNVWEYRYDSLFEPGYVRWEIVADSTSRGRPGFAAVVSHHDGVGRLVHERRAFWYYGEQARAAATDHTDPECSLTAPFPVPQHAQVEFTCGSDRRIWVRGGYTDGKLLLGTDTVRYPAWKWFENVAGGFSVYHGIGVPGWSVEGSTDSAHLIFARLGGVSYGESVVTTSTEGNAMQPVEMMTADIYPNPISDRFTIDAQVPPVSRLRYEVIDVLGRTVLSGEFEARQTTIDASTLASGLYFVRLLDELRVRTTRAVVKTAAR